MNCTIVHNSGQWFCCFAGHLEMEWVMRVYGQSLVKKKGRYWPKGVPGDMIGAYFQGKPIGYSESFETTFDNHPFFVHCTKGLLYFVENILQPVSHIFFLSLYAEEKYVTKFMSLFGCLNPVQVTKPSGCCQMEQLPAGLMPSLTRIITSQNTGLMMQTIRDTHQLTFHTLG